MKQEQKEQAIHQLKRRGYTVTQTATAKGLLVEKETFWGYFQYDSDIGQNNSKMKWMKVGLLTIFWCIGLIGAVYWLYQKDKAIKEVTAILNESR